MDQESVVQIARRWCVGPLPALDQVARDRLFSKTLLRSAEIFHYAEHAKNYGLKIEGKVTPDLKAIVDRSRGIAQRMNSGVGFLMKKNKVDVIWGEAKLTKPNEIVYLKRLPATAK